MSLTKKHLVVYVLIALFIVFSQYRIFEEERSTMMEKPVLTFYRALLDTFLEKYDENVSLNPYWGLPEEKRIPKSPSKTIETVIVKVPLKVEQPKGKNVLCITSSCYKLLGIHYSKDIPYIILYNKNFKEKTKSYTLLDTLESNIFISTIDSDKVEFKEHNSTRVWKFKLFDVNQKKYKPKEREE